MKRSKFSLNRLSRKSQKGNLIVFGAGQNCVKFFSDELTSGLEQNIAYIVDNAPEKWGKPIKIRGKEFEIFSPEILDRLVLEKYIILITPSVYKSIFCQLQAKYIGKRIICCTIPKTVYSIENAFKWIMTRLPLKNIILLRGEGDTCENAMALAAYMREKKYDKKYKLVWLCNHPERFLTSKEKHLQWKTLENSAVLAERLQYYYYTCRAKYLLFENTYINKMREDQISVYLKHGETPLKATKGIIVMPEDLSFTIAASEFSEKIISEQYSINKERIFRCGTPRTDILFSKHYDKNVIDSLQINKYTKTILWMPTFRQHCDGKRNDSNKNYSKGIPIIYSDDDLKKIAEVLKRHNVQIILKPHKYQDLSYISIEDIENFKVITQDQIESWKLDTHRIMRYVDALITDYSSVAFDYMLLNRPIAYTIDDIDDYKLGFVQKDFLQLMPGEKIQNIDGFMTFVDDVANGKDNFIAERMYVRELIAGASKGESCSEMCKYLGLE